VKSLSKFENLDDIKNKLSNIESKNSSIIVWEVVDNKRTIYTANLVEIIGSENLDVQTSNGKEFKFSSDNIYFYVEEEQIIFKALKNSISETILNVVFPEEIKILDQSESKDLQYSLVEMDASLKDKFNIYNDEILKVKGYDFDSIKAEKTNDYYELNSEREKIQTDYDVIDTEREKIQTEYESHDTAREHIEYKDLSGKTYSGTDDVTAKALGGNLGTENLNTSMAGKSSTEKFSTTEKAGYKGTERVETKEKAGYKGTDKVETKERVKNLESEAEISGQSDRDKAIFEEELSFVSLDEEDKFFADKRDAPRAKPKEGKTVLMRKKTDSSDHEGNRHPLFDLSRGGLGAIADSEDLYSKGDIILVMGFDENILDDPMQAIVRSVREADAPGHYKIGMQFYTGDDD
jgi:hypothetical protein